MRKIFLYFFSFFSLILSVSQTFAGLDIISREQWGADENIRFLDSKEWINIKKEESEYSKQQKNALEAYNLREQKANQYFQTFFPDQQAKTLLRDSENGRKMFWPIETSNKMQGIIIHHTVYDYDDVYQGVQRIYREHTLDNKWGDIGYNFLIGKKGEIFEGRAGGETAIAAHTKWNNVGNFGIGIMGDFSHDDISAEQKQSLKKLMRYLTEKYHLDLHKKVYFHTTCTSDFCNNVLKSELSDPIIGHKDAGHTGCPGDHLYEDIGEIKNEITQHVGFSFFNMYKLRKNISRYSKNILYVQK